MLNMLRVDFLILRRTFLIFFGLIILGIASKSFQETETIYLFFSKFSGFWFFIAFYGLIQTEEMHGFSKITFSLPQKRKTIVSVRFMEILLIGILAGLTFFCLNIFRSSFIHAYTGALIYNTIIVFIGSLYLLVYYIFNKSLYAFLSLMLFFGVFILYSVRTNIDVLFEKSVISSNFLKILIPLIAIVFNNFCSSLSKVFVYKRSY